MKTFTAKIMACAQLVMATLSALVYPAGRESTVSEEGTFAKRTLVSTTVNVSKCPTMRNMVSRALVCPEPRGVYVSSIGTIVWTRCQVEQITATGTVNATTESVEKISTPTSVTAIKAMRGRDARLRPTIVRGAHVSGMVPFHVLQKLVRLNASVSLVSQAQLVVNGPSPRILVAMTIPVRMVQPVVTKCSPQLTPKSVRVPSLISLHSMVIGVKSSTPSICSAKSVTTRLG